LTDFATIAASGGAMVLRVRDRASLHLNMPQGGSVCRLVLFREAALHKHPKERQRTIGAPASRQDENSGAKALNRRESPEHPAGGFPFFGSLKTVLSFRKRKERTGFSPHPATRRGTIATPFLLSLAKEETVLRAKEERRFRRALHKPGLFSRCGNAVFVT